MTRTSWIRWLGAIVCTLLLAAWTRAHAQEAPTSTPPLPPSATSTAPLAASPTSTPPLPPIVVERAYYVPFEKLEAIFEAQGRGIFLPYEQFLELWGARPTPPPKPEPEPPTPAVIRGGAYAGAVDGAVARLEVRYLVESLKKGWTEIALPLGGVAVESARVTGEGALFAPSGRGYALYMPKPGVYELTLALAAPVSEEPGRKSIRLQIPRTAVSRLELAIPEPDARVEIAPALARTETREPGRTRVLAFLGDATDVTVRWMPPPGAAVEQGAIVLAAQQVTARLGERSLRIAARIDYEVLRGQVDTLKVRAPDDTRVLAVKGDNMREWAPEGDAIVVKLHAPIQKTYRLELSFERILQETPERLAIPFPRAEDVLRESGWFVLGYDDGLLVRVTGTRGLSQLDPSEVPDPLRAQLGLGFRYLAHPLALDLGVERLEPVVRAETASIVVLGRDEDLWLGRVDYQIQKAGLFQLALRVPATWSVESIGAPGQVEEVRTEDADGQRTIRVSLRAKAFGAYRLPFRLVREGSGKPGEVALAPPVVLGAEQDRGLLGVAAPRAIDLAATALTQLTDADQSELVRTGLLAELSAQAGLPRAFRYREQPATGRFTLADKKTEVEALVQHLVEVSDAEVRITHLLDLDVLHAPVERLRFRAPTALDQVLKVEAKQKTEVTRERAGQGADAHTVWTVRFQPPVLGAVTLTLTHPLELAGLAPGAPTRVAIPLVRPLDVQSEQGFLAIRKEGTLEIAPAVEGFEAIDALELPPKLRRGQIYSTFRAFGERPALALTLTRFELEELATTIVQLIRMESVLGEEGKLKSRATLFVQNTERQYLEVRLPGDGRILALTVDGRPQAPKKRKEGAGSLIQIPRSAGAAGTFPIAIDYEESIGGEMARSGERALETLEVLGDVPVGKVEVVLYLPPGYVYGGFRGNLSLREHARPDLWQRFKALLTGADLAAGREGAQGRARAGAQALVIDLPTEGYERLVFDTLAPRGRLTWSYLDAYVYRAMDLGVLVAALAVTLVLVGRGGRPGQLAGLAALVAAVATSAATRDPTRGLAESAVMGVGGAFAAAAAIAIVRRARAWRAARAASSGPLDPFLEDVGLPLASAGASAGAATAASASATTTSEAGGAAASPPEASRAAGATPPPPARKEPGAGEGPGDAKGDRKRGRR